MTGQSYRWIMPFRAVTLDDLPRVGGKNASLAETVRNSAEVGMRVPDAFAVTAAAFHRHLSEAWLVEEINHALDRLDVHDNRSLAETAARLRERVRTAPLPADIRAEIEHAYAALSRQFGEDATDVAARSSATAGDRDWSGRPHVPRGNRLARARHSLYRWHCARHGIPARCRHRFDFAQSRFHRDGSATPGCHNVPITRATPRTEAVGIVTASPAT